MTLYTLVQEDRVVNPLKMWMSLFSLGIYDPRY